MSAVVQTFNLGLTKLFNAICWPFLSLEPIWAMIVISFLTGLLMLWLWGKISNQEAIKKVKDKIRGNLIGVRLFQDDLGITMRLQGRILRYTLSYMKYAVLPMFVLIIPVILVMIQLNLRFSVRPLQEGEQALVEVQLRQPAAMQQRIALEAPEGVTVETPPVRIEAQQQVAWRIRADKSGRYALLVGVGDQTVEKELVVGSSWGAVSSLRTGKNLADILLWPGEAPIGSSSPVESVEIRYAALALPWPLVGWDIHWLIDFFVLSVVFGFAFKDVFGVQI